MEPDDLNHPPAPDSLDVLHYDIHLREVDEAEQRILATTTIRIKALRPLTAVDLNMAGLTPLSVEVRRLPGNVFVPVGHGPPDGDFHIGPFSPMRPGEQFEIKVDYEGTDPSCLSLFGIPSGMIFSRFGAHTFSEPSGARHWFPCHDVPWDKATAKLTIDMDPGRETSATGVLIEDTEVNGKRRRSWLVEEPAATYLLAVYFGDFIKIEDPRSGDVPLEYFVYPELEEKARIDFSTVPEMMAFFSSVHPYPFARYAMTLGFFPGGMEHQTNSLIGWSSIRGDQLFEDLYAHELAHMWWGDMITPATWRDIWLNEGFATYFDLLFTERRYGWPALQRRMAVLDSVYQSRPDLDHMLGHPPVERVLSFIVYNKGAHLLHMLRSVSRLRLMSGPPAAPEAHTEAALEGDRRFFEIFSHYAKKHAYGNASSGQFQAAAEAVLGEDLTWFFHPWLYGLGYPDLQYDWRADPIPGGTTVRVRVDQEQTTDTVFRMPLHVRYVDGDEILDEVRYLDGRSTTWDVVLPSGNWNVVLDPDDWLLKTLSQSELITALERLAVSPNPSAQGFTFTGELAGADAAQARLSVFDIQGRLVAVRDLGRVGPGPIQAKWDGMTGGRAAAAGVYLGRLEVGRQEMVRRLVVLPN